MWGLGAVGGRGGGGGGRAESVSETDEPRHVTRVFKKELKREKGLLRSKSGGGKTKFKGGGGVNQNLKGGVG